MEIHCPEFVFMGDQKAQISIRNLHNINARVGLTVVDFREAALNVVPSV